MLHKKAASVLLALGYLLNPDGSRASIIEQTQAVDAQQQPIFDTNGAPLLEQQRRTDYTYDAVKRLVNEVVDARTDANDRSTAWTYDAVGNRQTQSQQANVGAVINRDQRTYTYDANDRLLTETKSVTANGNTNTTTTTHRYDLNGNLVETIQPNALERYRWNAENRLAQHEKTTNGQTAITQYAYTADGLRNRITANANTANAITTRQLIDPNQAYAQVIEETIQLGANTPQLKTVYTHGDDLLAQHAIRNSDGTTATIGTSYLHYDGLGTTRFLSNASGNVTDRYTYQAFGEIDEAASSFAFGATAATDYLFTGEQFDPNLGFYYLRARFMNPSSGRFASQDTYAGNSSDPVTLHKYLYANGNPAMGIDPSGNMTLGEVMSAVNTVGNLQTLATISVNILTGNYGVAAGQIAEEVVYSKLGALGKPLAGMSKRAISLFYNVFGRTVKLRLGKRASGTTLDYNLKQVGVTKPGGDVAAHHIIAGTAKSSASARRVLKQHNIDINSPVNGVYLPSCKSSNAVGSLHCGGHAQDYFEKINQRILAADAAGGKIAVLNELGAIKLDLLSGEIPLNSFGQ